MDVPTVPARPHYFLRPLHVVLIDPHEADRGQTRQILIKQGYPEFHVYDFATTDAAVAGLGLGAEQTDGVLLSATSDAKLMEDFKQLSLVFAGLPIILVTQSIDMDLAYELIRGGADNLMPRSWLSKDLLPLFFVKAAAMKSRRSMPDGQVQRALQAAISVRERNE